MELPSAQLRSSSASDQGPATDAQPDGHDERAVIPSLMGWGEDPFAEFERLARTDVPVSDIRAELRLDGDFPDDEIRRATLAAVRGVTAARDGRTDDANRAFRGIQAFVASTRNPHYYFLLRSHEVMARCQSREAEGRLDEVVKLTSALAQEAEDAAIGQPDIKTVALMSRMVSLNVEISYAARRGDIDRAENSCARLQAKANEALEVAECKPCPLSLSAYSSLIAVEQLHWQLAMDAYDFRGALEQLKRVKPIVHSFTSDPEWRDPRFAATVSMNVIWFTTSWDLSMMSAEVLLDRKRRTRARARAYGTLRTNSIRLEQLAQAMRSPQLALQARAIRARVQSIEKADQAQGKDWGRYGGVLTLVAFCIYVVLVWGVVKPDGTAVLPLLLAGLIIALVAGFGTTALMFMPMLKLFNPTQGPAPGNDEAGSK